MAITIKAAFIQLATLKGLAYTASFCDLAPTIAKHFNSLTMLVNDLEAHITRAAAAAGVDAKKTKLSREFADVLAFSRKPADDVSKLPHTAQVAAAFEYAVAKARARAEKPATPKTKKPIDMAAMLGALPHLDIAGLEALQTALDAQLTHVRALKATPPTTESKAKAKTKAKAKATA